MAATSSRSRAATPAASSSAGAAAAMSNPARMRMPASIERKATDFIRDTPSLVSSWNPSSFFDRLRVDGQLDFVTDNNAPAVEDTVPVDAEVFSVDPRRGEKAGARLGSFVDTVLPPWCFPLTQEAHVEGHWPGNAPDGELSGHSSFIRTDELEALARESNGRVVLDIEEVSALQVSVSGCLSAPEAGRVDRGLDGGGFRMVWIEVESSVNVLDEAAHAGHHHVARAKFRRSVSWFKRPFSHRSSSRLRPRSR